MRPSPLRFAFPVGVRFAFPVGVRFALLLSLFPGVQTAAAQAAFFDAATDVIRVDGQTVIGSASTYEAVLLFPSTGGAGGSVFNEWANGLEDKSLYADPTFLVAYNFPAATSQTAFATLTPDVWHHVAFVYDGTEERLYLDGVLIGSRAMSITVGNGAGLAHVGGIFRESLRGGFIGYITSLRVSDVARYTGASFTPPPGDMAPDANTRLLLNFNEPAGSTTVHDAGPAGRTGTLGVGFAGATSPELGAVVVAAEPAAGGGAVTALHAPAPNPATGRAALRYSLAAAGPARLALYDALGREVAVLLDGETPAGSHESTLDAARLAPGLYVARLTTPEGTLSQRVTVVR